MPGRDLCSADSLDRTIARGFSNHEWTRMDTKICSDSRPLVSIRGSFFVQDRKSTRLNSSHTVISYAVFCLKKKKKKKIIVVLARKNNNKVAVYDMKRIFVENYEGL